MRDILSGDSCVPAAPVFDPLSARIAQVVGWEVCKLSGSVWKAANLALPDDVPLANPSDTVDICRRIQRMAPDVSLLVDVDDAGGTELTAFRTVRELEAAGASGIEIEDTMVPLHFGDAVARHSLLISKEQQVSNLRSAVAARQDPSTVITARTSALNELPTDEALDRIHAYSSTGVDALMFPRMPPRGRADIEAVREVSELPLCVLGLSAADVSDAQFLATNRIRVRYLGTGPYRIAIKAIYDSLKHMKDGGSPDDLKGMEASPEIVQAVNRRAEFLAWQDSYGVKGLEPHPAGA